MKNKALIITLVALQCASILGMQRAGSILISFTVKSAHGTKNYNHAYPETVRVLRDILFQPNAREYRITNLRMNRIVFDIDRKNNARAEVRNFKGPLSALKALEEVAYFEIRTSMAKL